MKTYNFKMYYFSKVNHFVHSKTTTLLLMQKGTQQFYVFTHPINISQNKIQNVMRHLIYFCFKSGEKQFIFVEKN